MATGLARDRRVDGIIEFSITDTSTKQRPEVCLVVMTKTHVQRPCAGEGDAIAAFAEVVCHGRDEAEAVTGLSHPKVACGAAGAVIGLLKRPGATQAASHE